MKILAYLFILFLLAIPVAVVGAAYLAVDDFPMVNRSAELTPAHIERALRVVKRNDPRTMDANVLRTISLSQEEVDLALNYLADRYGRGSSRIVLQPGAVAISASIGLPANPLGNYLNVTAVLHETNALPVFDILQVGQVQVPALFADWLLENIVQQLNSREDYRVASDTIKTVSVADGRLTITYDWQADLPDRIKSVVLPREDQDRLKVYQDRLVAALGQAQGATSASLADVFTPLFRLAAERGASGDPVAENRAAIVVVTFFVNGKGLGAIVPAARNWPQPPRRKVLLVGREDFPQHFTISMAIAANAGAPLSDAIGLYKEVDDSRGGSGFSFNDIAADRAGTRFGQLAAGSRESASRLQNLVGAGVAEADILPPVSDLPEFMPEAEFKMLYGGIGGPPYKKMMEDIERRVAALPLYR